MRSTTSRLTVLSLPRKQKAGLVDEFQMIACPAVVGSGERFFRVVCGWTST
jgi:hypothetical protein